MYTFRWCNIHLYCNDIYIAFRRLTWSAFRAAASRVPARFEWIVWAASFTKGDSEVASPIDFTAPFSEAYWPTAPPVDLTAPFVEPDWPTARPSLIRGRSLQGDRRTNSPSCRLGRSLSQARQRLLSLCKRRIPIFKKLWVSWFQFWYLIYKFLCYCKALW